ncbi:hypothetical protein LRB11_14820 [Ectothiorhodospira haloalkaliphila]|uniref:hypothetical protein n=1 Tax=Ectothiorhodospira haloalkaliphila TaxID=421628 RepID=UPI001EE8EF4A|nr:hypothetical protein [Ectothiorhodospira haloalkaliphila]MCG5526188.1 hypothetical protein [Ectothiorhodospira haloalkaliphila]
MHAQLFRKRVEDFAQQYCQPHMRCCRIEWDLEPDRPRAVVRCEDYQAISWDIPMQVAAGDPEKVLIPLASGEGLEASKEGFFRFIWHNSRYLTHG